MAVEWGTIGLLLPSIPSHTKLKTSCGSITNIMRACVCELVLGYLKGCELVESWHELAHDQAVWWLAIRESSVVLNQQAEMQEKEQKDARKWSRGQRQANDKVSVQDDYSAMKRLRRMKQADDEGCLQRDYPGCSFKSVRHTGLLNHQRQKHVVNQRVVSCSRFFGSLFLQQGLFNHEWTFMQQVFSPTLTLGLYSSWHYDMHWSKRQHKNKLCVCMCVQVQA